jgi:lipoprotein-anchoring transpeptidase ErfK/SrfK
MRNLWFSALAILVVWPQAVLADRIVARVSIATQTMHVYRDGLLLHEWPVSTARAGKITPRGEWTAQWLSRNHRSSRYNNAPMPYAIFYSGHYAIHGTDQISRLGRPASAGCVRLHPDNARILFRMVQEEGTQNMRVVVVN